MITLEINHIIASTLFKVFWNKNTTKFSLLKLVDTDINFTVIDYYEDCLNKINFILIEENEVCSNLICDIFDVGEFLTFEFESEEDAVYFKMKYCS